MTRPEQVFALMDGLEQRAELFAALSDPGHEYWIDLPSCRSHIQEMQLFRVRQLTPVLFAAWEALSRDDFARVLKMIARLTFRHTVVTGLNTNELEPVSHAGAKALLDGEVKSLAQLFDRLRPIYVEKDRLVQAFAELNVSTRGQKKKLVKYIFCALERDASGRPCDYMTEPGTIEHILPENPGAEWDVAFSQDRQEKYVYRLGNLALLEAAANRNVGNGGYETKVQAYAKSNYDSTKSIASLAPEEWTADLLHERQRQMALRAEHLWRSDFAD